MNRKMLLYTIPLILVLSMSYFIAPTPASTSTYDFPRLDDLYETIAFPRTYALSAAQSCQIDNYLGMTVVADINVMHAAPYYWNISLNPGFHECYIGINCREVTIDTSGSEYNYHGRTPGFNLYPLNISQFRYALEVIVSGFKSAWLTDIYGFIVLRQDKVVPPANAFWYNPCIPLYPSDWSLAESLLTGAGFVWDKGPDATGHTADDKWTCPNGLVLWDGTRASQPKSDRLCGVSPNVYGFWVMCPGPTVATTSYEVTMRHLEMWNLFFTGHQDGRGVVGNDPNQRLFIDDGQSDSSVISIVAFMNRDHDLYMLCWGLARNPDYLWDFFDPTADVFDGANSPGLVHAGLDRVLDTVKYWLFEDYDLLAYNVGPPCPPTVVVNPCTNYGPIGPFDAPVPFNLEVERVSAADGVYDEELTSPTQYVYSWSVGLGGKYYLTIHIEAPITLNPGDALEVKFPAGTYSRLITQVSEMQKVVYLAQWKLWYLAPYLPIYSRNYVNMYKTIIADNKFLDGWIESSGYGSEPTGADMPWTTNNLHWNNQLVGGSMNYHVSGAIYTLNPIAVVWTYEVQILNRMYDPLTVVNPYTEADMPWIALNWTIEPWADKNYGVNNGMVIDVWIRDDAYWQDGNHITTEDMRWSYEFIESLTAPEFLQVWQPLIKTEVIGPYEMQMFVNATGLWQFYITMGSALTFPKAAWEDFEGDYNPDTTTDYDAAVAYTPWTVLRSSKPGMVTTGPYAAPSDLTMLYGAGPYYFRYWDKLTGKGVVKLSKNPNYWARVNMRKTQTTLGIDGLLTGKWYGEYWGPTPFGTPEPIPAPVVLNVALIDINMKASITFSKDITMFHWGTNAYANTHELITLNPGDTDYELLTVDLFPLASVVGDLGKRAGTPPSAKWFQYDGKVDGTDLALFLNALTNKTIAGVKQYPVLLEIKLDVETPSHIEITWIKIFADWLEPSWSD